MKPRIGVALIVAAVFPSLLTWLYYDALSGQATGLKQTVYLVGKTLQFGFPLVWLMLVERGGHATAAPLAPPARRWPMRRGLALGLGFGLVVAAGMWLGYASWFAPAGYMEPIRAQLREKLSGMGIATPAAYFALGAFYSLLHSGLEEYYWRWFVFGRGRRLLRFWPAAILGSLAFAAHHAVLMAVFFGWLSPMTWFLTVSVAVGGIVWAWLYERTGSLLAPWLSHALVDAAIFIVGWDLIGGLR